MTIQIAGTEEAIRACFPVFSELRPHLAMAPFTAQVQRQMKDYGYRLVYIQENEKVVAGAGYRVAEFLAWGKTFYLDDLVTAASARKKGYGGMLMDWLLKESEKLGCKEFHLDSGVQRHDAHRLYIGRKMKISSYHFSKNI